MTSNDIEEIREGMFSGAVVPYLGPEALLGVTDRENGQPIPADSNSLILTVNGGRPMAPKLMYEFSRAAMNLELKKGRKFIERVLTETYAQRQWSRSELHAWLAELKLPYVIDTNRDEQLQRAYEDRRHTLVLGLARISGTDYRFKIFEFTGETYVERSLETVNTDLPVVFKPLGTPRPEPNFVASDADYVDYITELMGGFAIPKFIKDYRKNKRYVVLGTRFARDTERMIFSELMYGAPRQAGWVFLDDPTKKEVQYCQRVGLKILPGSPAQIIG